MNSGGFSRRGAWPDAVNPLDVASDKIVQRGANMAFLALVFALGRSCQQVKRGADAALGLGFFYRRFEAGRERASQQLELVGLTLSATNRTKPLVPPASTSPVPSESDPQDVLVQKNWQVDLQPPKRPGTLGTATGALRPPLDVLEGAKRAGGGTHSEAPSHVGPYSPARTRIGRRRGPKRRALIYILAYITICSV